MSQNRKSSDGVDDGILLGTTWPGGTLQQPCPYPLPLPSPPSPHHFSHGRGYTMRSSPEGGTSPNFSPGQAVQN